MNRYMIKVKEINTDCYCVDSETIEEAKDELMENFGDYCGNGMGEGSLEILEAEKVFTNIKQDKEGRILGFIEPTPQREAEAISKLFNIPVYPEGHPKEGQHITSIKEHREMQMPEELEQFEQQGRL